MYQLIEKNSEDGAITVTYYRNFAAALSSVSSLIERQDYEAARVRLRAVVGSVSLATDEVLFSNGMGKEHFLKSALDGLTKSFELGVAKGSWAEFEGAKRKLLLMHEKMAG